MTLGVGIPSTDITRWTRRSMLWKGWYCHAERVQHVVEGMTGGGVLDESRPSGLNAAIYPARGVETSLGRLGLRFELGDEIYLNKGAHSDFRFTFGPILRF